MKISSRYIGCFSDIHLGLGQDSKQWHEIALNFAKWASEYYKENSIDEIIIPGDIFHNRSEVSVETLDIAKRFFDYFKDFTIYISTGNHDCYYKDNSSVNSISILAGWNNIKIIDSKPELIETNYDKKIALIPWGTEIKDMPNSDIMFAHLEISSFYMNGHKMCEHGMESKNLFDKTKFVVSGHFHKKDHRKYDKGDILYLGSPFQHNFGDLGDSRGIYVFDVKESTFKFIENNISPKHYRLTPESEIKEDIVKNNIISLVINDKNDEKTILEFSSKISTLSPINLRIDYEKPKDEIMVNDEDKEYKADNILKSIEEYIKTLDIENKKEVEECIKTIYNSLI